MELNETTQLVFERVRETNPSRVVFDSLSEMRLLAQKPAALPPTDPGVEALLLRPPVHGCAARRPLFRGK